MILTFAGVNLGASVWLAFAPANVLRRAFTLAYVVLSLFLFVLAAGVIAQLEYSTNWRATRNWTSIQPGMSQAQVTALLGPPHQIAEQFYFYDLHPLTGLEGNIEFEDTRVKSAYPPDGAAWTSQAMRTWFHGEAKAITFAFGFLGIAVVAIASLVPVGGRAALPLYYPLFTIILALLYESVQSPGWRFDLMFLVPAYCVVGVAWLVRVLYRRSRRRNVLP